MNRHSRAETSRVNRIAPKKKMNERRITALGEAPMTGSPMLSLALYTRAYAEAYAHHGDLNLDLAAFGRCLQQIVEQQCEPEADTEAVVALLAKLHKNDLYLTCACAMPIDAA